MNQPFYLLWCGIGVAFGACLYDPCSALITRCRGEGAKKSIILVTLIAAVVVRVAFGLRPTSAEEEIRDARVMLTIVAGKVVGLAVDAR